MISSVENKRSKRRKNKKTRAVHKVGNDSEAYPIPLEGFTSKQDEILLDEVEDLDDANALCELCRENSEMQCLLCDCESPEQHQLLQDKRGLADGCEEGEENVHSSRNMTSQDYLPLAFEPESGDDPNQESRVCSCGTCLNLAKKNQSCTLSGSGSSLEGSGLVGSFPLLSPHRQQRESSKEEELKNDWTELKCLLHHMYRETGLTLGEALTPHLPPPCSSPLSLQPSDHRFKDIVYKLCRQDAHKLYLCLESQVKLFVVEMRLRLLMQVGGDINNLNSSGPKPFVCLMLEEYAKLCLAASRVAPYLEELEVSHLKGFKLTWELVNRHLFQSIVYDDPLLHSRLTIKLSQHRVANSSSGVCNGGCEKCHHDSFSAVTKFDDEMTVLSVLWREAQHLIEVYDQEQAARAKQGLELFHAQWKQLMEENLNLSIFQRFPVLECQKSCSHGGQDASLKGHCPKTESPNFLSPLELVSLAEQVGAPGGPPPPLSAASVTPPGPAATTAVAAGRNAGCIKSSPYHAKMPRQARLLPNISSGFKYLRDNYQKPGLDCLTGEILEAGNVLPLLPPPPPPPLFPPLPPNVPDRAGTCCQQHQSATPPRDPGVNQNACATKCTSTAAIDHRVSVSAAGVSHQQLKSSASFKGGGVSKSTVTEEMETRPTTATAATNTVPESMGCECHSCIQQQQLHDLHIDPRLLYEGGVSLGDLSPTLLTGLKSMISEASGSPSALAVVKQLIHPHLYNVHLNNNSNNNNSNGHPVATSKANKTTLGVPAPVPPTNTFFPEPFDLKLETQYILREQIKLVAMGDWDCDIDEARSLLLHHYHNSLKQQHRTSATPTSTNHGDLPAASKNFFPPISLANNPHSILRGEAHLPSSACQSCKGDSEEYPDEEELTEDTVVNSNGGVINNLGHTGRKLPCLPGKGWAAPPREHNGIIPEGYGSVGCSASNGRHQQNSNSSDSNLAVARAPDGGGGGLSIAASCGSNLVDDCGSGSISGSSSSLSSLGAERGGSHHGCCEGHHGGDAGDESGPDDSCSEQSSSTSTSNQRESRVCDCCYCEVFGHGVPIVAPVSRNYPEMRDRLRLRLSKRKAEVTSTTGNVIGCEKNEPLEDSRALEELLRFINGPESDKAKQRKGKRKGPKKSSSNPGQLGTEVEEELLQESARLSLTPPPPVQGSEHSHHQELQRPSSSVSQQTLPAVSSKRPTKKKINTPGQHVGSSLHVELSSRRPESLPTVSSERVIHPTNHNPTRVVKPNPEVAKSAAVSQPPIRCDRSAKVDKHALSRDSAVQLQKTAVGLQSIGGNRRTPAEKMVNGTSKVVDACLAVKNCLKEPLLPNPKQVTPAPPPPPPTTTTAGIVPLKQQQHQRPLAPSSVSAKAVVNPMTVTTPVIRPEPKQDLSKAVQYNNNNNNNNNGPTTATTELDQHSHLNGSLTAKELLSTAAACIDGKSARNKKSKKKKNGGDDATSPDDVFMPKDIDLENGELDEFEKELEAFKRFCFNSVPLANKEKVHVNLKDIVVKKKSNGNGVAVANGHKL